MHPVNGNIASLRQGLDLVRKLDRSQYTYETDLCPGGTVGAHFRHCLEFYLCFLDGLATGVVDYDSRKRRVEVETLLGAAVDCFEQVLSALEPLREDDLNRPLAVRGDGPVIDDSALPRSTVGRELQFLLSHTVHHHALIGFMLRAQGVDPDPSFGVAPSTLRHWEKTGSRRS